MPLHLALIGDHNPDVPAHRGIPRALALAAVALGQQVTSTWHHTASLTDPPTQLATAHALWCVPASPYTDMQNALNAIRFARESRRPFLGTCGGFQHALLEFARNVLHLPDADHTESNPTSRMPLLSLLECDLVEKSALHFTPNSRLHHIYNTTTAEEQYRCRYALNPQYAPLFQNTDLHFTAHDPDGQPRAFELHNHPFFLATLFQPERSALRDHPPPHPSSPLSCTPQIPPHTPKHARSPHPQFCRLCADLFLFLFERAAHQN